MEEFPRFYDRTVHRELGIGYELDGYLLRGQVGAHVFRGPEARPY
jgi:hypothetical protein